jgi:hypothetical protein
VQLLQGEGTHRLQKPVSHRQLTMLRHDQRPSHQVSEHVRHTIFSQNVAPAAEENTTDPMLTNCSFP